MSINDITGDSIRSRYPTTEYVANYARIFGPKVKAIEPVEDETLYTCMYCGILTADPCDSLPPDVCEKAITSVYGDPTK